MPQGAEVKISQGGADGVFTEKFGKMEAQGMLMKFFLATPTVDENFP